MTPKRISAVFLVLLLLTAVGASAASAAEVGIAIRSVDTTEFPTVKVTATLPQDVDPADVSLIEDDKTVGGFDVQALTSTGREVEVVLAIDTSDSMAGEPLEAAIQAAKSFIELMPDNVALGVVSFDDVPHLLAPISTDHSAAAEAVSDLELVRGTALYDGVIKATQLFSGDAQRNILLLSDGADAGSAATLDEAIKKATEAEVGVFSIGLESGSFDESALSAMSNETSGVYQSASTGDLAAVFDGIGSAVTNQFVLTYRSSASRGSEVSVNLSGGEFTDNSLFVVPKKSPSAPPALDESWSPPGWLMSTPGLVTVLLLFFLAAFVVGVTLVGSNLRAKRERELARRMASAARPSIDEDAEGRGYAGWIPQPLIDIAGNFTEGASFTDALDAKLERAGLPIRAAEFVAASILGAALAFIFSGVFLRGALWLFLFSVIGGFAPKLLLALATNRRLAKLHSQLPDILMILASSLRAGHSFFQALDMVAKEIGDPGAEEFGRVVAEIRLGRAVDEALIAMGDRIGSEDFKWAVLAVNIQRDVGGNLAEVLDTVADTLREREVIRRQVKVLSAEGRLSMYILIALPVLVALYISQVNPQYLGLLFSTGPGRVMLITAVALLSVGVVWMKKIVRINV